MSSKKREWYKKLLVKLYLIKQGSTLTLDAYIREVENKLSTEATIKEELPSDYICSQCGRDENGGEIHTLTHHVFPPYTLEEAKKELASEANSKEERREETDAVEFAEWIKKQGYVPYKQSEDLIEWRKHINFPMETTNQLYEKFKSQLSTQTT